MKTKSKRGRRVKIKKFVQQCLDRKVFSPTEMANEYNLMYGLEGDKKKTRFAFTKAMRRLGISAKDRLELKENGNKAKDVKDVLEYEEVQRYLGHADLTQIGEVQKEITVRDLRVLWEWMGRTNPRLWKLDPDAPDEYNLISCLKREIGQDEKGQWKRKNQVLVKLGAFNRTFVGILPKNWSVGLKRPAGELKDHWEIYEYDDFENHIVDTRELSREGWISLFSTQITNGAREGSHHEGESGILGLRWENIDFTVRRCSLRDKGKRGHPLIEWTQVPLDLFPWLDNWTKLMRYWEQCGKPTHGRVFPISYNIYRRYFHAIRRSCKTRIRVDTEKQRPHILRKTHAQWCKRIGVTLDNLCGDTSTYPHIGRYGVGWSAPQVPRKYYLTKEPWEYEEQDQILNTRLSKPLNQLGFKVPKSSVETTPIPVVS